MGSDVNDVYWKDINCIDGGGGGDGGDGDWGGGGDGDGAVAYQAFGEACVKTTETCYGGARIKELLQRCQTHPLNPCLGRMPPSSLSISGYATKYSYVWVKDWLFG